MLKSAICSLKHIDSPEQEQAALRIAIPLAVLTYLILNKPESADGLRIWSLGINFVIAFLCFAAIVYASTFIWRKPSRARRVVGIIGDICGQSYALYITGPIGAPWYGLYLWIILGNGFRYGEKYLYLSTALALTGFTIVSVSNTYWINNGGLAIGLAFTLVLIPAYSALLIRRLNDALHRADAASRAKSDFLSCMSHEIRTPLNGILGMADLLRLRPLAADDKECVDTIHASGQALARQINDILDLSKIEAGELSMENIDFDLYALVNTTLRIFRPQVAAKQLQLQENLDPKTPYLLHGDPHKLRQVIINLVGNALKFTEQGFISVRIYPRKFTDDKVLLRFEVADTGIGIPLERQAAIFEPFTQADNSVSRSYGGTGLGTTICKNIVELMGGEIGIQSNPGVGTTFWFDIPFSTEDRKASDTNLSWAGDCKVLYIESGTGNGISRELGAWGIDYDSASTIEYAIKLLECRPPSEPYDAIVIEHAHYNNELISLLTDIEESEQLKHTSVILLNDHAFISEEDICKHDRLYVLSPESDKNILLNTLHASYSRHSTEEDIVHIAHHQVRAQTSPRTLEILIADDNATNRIVLQRMLEKLGHQCEVVDGGTAALEQLEENHYDAVIIDKNMPDLGGVETYQAYSLAHGGNPLVEFIVLTADATEESREACWSAGIELFMTKPVSLIKLQETLAAIKATGQAIKRESAAIKEPATPLNEQDSDELPVINETEFEGLVSLAGGNQTFITDLIRNFETDTDNDIRGLEAAVANHDLSQFRDFAHAMKGCALYLGLSKLAQLSLEAQQTEEDAFRRTGIARVRALQQAADDAISALHERESWLQVIG